MGAGMKYLVRRDNGSLITTMIRSSPYSSTESVREFDTFEAALRVATEIGNGTVCQIVPIAKVTTETTRRVIIDPLL